MRFIDQGKIVIPNSWLIKARKCFEDVSALQTREEKIEYIKRHSIWTDSELKEALETVSGRKCWYSEVEIVMADEDVDHFRPKSEARDLDGKSREGYWFLAFDWRNYRLSCEWSNRPRDGGGKGIFFPICPDSIYATHPGEVKDERHYLLDPCCEDDVLLITFNELGEAIPSSDEKFEIDRVMYSIDCYNLKNQKLVDDRRAKWNLVNRLIDEYIKLSFLVFKNEVEFSMLRPKIIDIQTEVDVKSKYSAIGIACLKSRGFYSLVA